ncbi:MAG: Crp/Fnr family transcriptional regulator [Sphingomicrobium sp.]
MMIPKSHPLDAFLHELLQIRELDQDDRKAVLALPVRLRKLDAHTYLVREGQLPAQCSLLLDGFAFRQKVTGDGSRQIMAVCIPGDAVDLQNMFLDVADHSVQMLTRGTVADIQRADLQQLVLSRPKVGAAIIQLTLIEASILREWVVNVGRRDARERVAHLLCEFAVRLEARGLDAENGFELPMTQEQLADTTGLTPVHVNRVLKTLEADGLISRKRRHIQFPDWRALQDAGDFNRQYLHLPSEDIVAHVGQPANLSP